MDSYNFFYVCHMLTLVNSIAGSHVLVAGNEEAFKSLAKKFVPQKLADKLASLVSQATSGYENQYYENTDAPDTNQEAYVNKQYENNEYYEEEEYEQTDQTPKAQNKNIYKKSRPVQVNLDELVEKVKNRILLDLRTTKIMTRPKGYNNRPAKRVAFDKQKDNEQDLPSNLEERNVKSYLMSQRFTQNKQNGRLKRPQPKPKIIQAQSSKAAAKLKSGKLIENHDLFKKFDLAGKKKGKNKDSYEDYVTPKKESDIFISEEENKNTNNKGKQDYIDEINKQSESVNNNNKQGEYINDNNKQEEYLIDNKKQGKYINNNEDDKQEDYTNDNIKQGEYQNNNNNKQGERINNNNKQGEYINNNNNNNNNHKQDENVNYDDKQDDYIDDDNKQSEYINNNKNNNNKDKVQKDKDDDNNNFGKGSKIDFSSDKEIIDENRPSDTKVGREQRQLKNKPQQNMGRLNSQSKFTSRMLKSQTTPQYEDYDKPKDYEKPKDYDKPKGNDEKIIEYADDIDQTEGTTANHVPKALTEFIGDFEDDKPTLSTARTKENKQYLNTKRKPRTIATNMATRERFTIYTPTYYANLPKVAEKYNFDEPIPDRDKEEENLKDIGNPPAHINGKVKV